MEDVDTITAYRQWC